MPDPLERFTNDISRRLAGQPAPERDVISDRSDPEYLAQLARERAYDAQADEDDDQADGDDATEGLNSFADRAARAMGFPYGEPVGEDDGGLEDPGPVPEADPMPTYERWFESLDEAGQERVRAGDVGWATASFVDWQTQDAAREEFNRANWSDGSEPEAEGDDAPMPQTGAAFVDWAHANAQQIRAEFGMTVPEYLAAMAGANAEEWRQIVRETGVGPDAKPSYMQLGPRGQTELLRNDLNREMERLREQGRHIE